MSGFEMSPFGAVPIGTPSLKNADPAFAAQFVVKPDYGNGETFTLGTPESATLPAAPKQQARLASPTSPRSVIAGARARVKEIKTELKRLRALQTELGELERLLKAAKQKPTPSVRSLRSVG